MDYRGIITRGYHVDVGGQNTVGIITQGYLSQITEAVFIASKRIIVSASEWRIIGAPAGSDERRISSSYESRTIKGNT